MAKDDYPVKSIHSTMLFYTFMMMKHPKSTVINGLKSVPVTKFSLIST